MVDVKILLVEDNSVEAMGIKRALESFGYSVHYIVSNANDAIEYALKFMPDLILMDIILQGDKDGIDAAMEIAKLNIPIIYLTALTDNYTLKKVKETEPYGYITKPYKPQELRYAVEIALYRKSVEKLKKSEEKHRSLFETMSIGVVYQDNNGHIISMNPQAEKIMGMTIEEIRCKTPSDKMWDVINEDGTPSPGNLRPSMRALKTGKKIKGVVLGIKYPVREGYTWVKIDAVPEFKPNEKEPYQVYTTFEDVTEQKHAEERIKILNETLERKVMERTSNLDDAVKNLRSEIVEREKVEKELKRSLEDKNILLREIHHRVKNNLQIIASLIHLQKMSTDTEDDVKNVLNETEGRIKTMAIIHEKLYQSPHFTDINIHQYIEKLVKDIFYTYGIPLDKIERKIVVEDINLNIDTAIPLGLIINELVTNTVKYAFLNSTGTLTLKIKSLDDSLELVVSDNGIGMSNDINIEQSKTLGLQLVDNLVKQLDGSIQLELNHGTEYRIKFKQSQYKTRN